MSITPKQKLRRQIKLSDMEVAHLKSEQEKHPTKVAAGIALGINPDTLDRAIRIGSCNETSYRILFPEIDIDQKELEFESTTRN